MSTAAPTPEPVSVHHVAVPAPSQLPDDLATLKRMIIELVASLHEERRDKEELRQRVQRLLEQLYGRRSERLDPHQLLLFALGADTAPDPADAAAAAPAQPQRPRHARPHGRRPLPANLPRRPLHHELGEAERRCLCGQMRIDIGSDVTEQLDWQPASYFVWQHHTHKYLCPGCGLAAVGDNRGAACPPTTAAAVVVATESEPAAARDAAAATTAAATTAAATAAAATAAAATADAATAAAATADAAAAAAATADAATADAATADAATAAATTPAAAGRRGPAIVSAPKPVRGLARGLPGPGLLAHVIVSKYFDHLPLYRQEHIFARQGVLLNRSTTCDWMAACAELLRPLYQHMVTVVLQSRWLHTDDTTVQNLQPAPGTTDQAHLWVYLGDRDHPYNVFDFTVNRRRDGPQTFLADFAGYLHADAFSGYDALYLPPACADRAPIVEVACNAHARRKFYEARTSDVVHAHQALAYYGQLYELERAATAQGFDDDQRRQLRQELAVPILDKFRAWLEAERAQVLPKSPMGEAIGYALNNWSALIRYTEAGFLSIDNNVAEREMKRIAVGRKNWLFVGSAQGGRTAAVLFSFTSTCHRLKIEPWAYLQDVLARLPTTPVAGLGELVPDRWQAARLQAVPPDAAAESPSPS